MGIPEEAGRTARFAIARGSRTALLCLLLLFAAAAGAVFLYIYLVVLPGLFEAKQHLV